MMGDWFKFDELKVKLDTMTDEEFVRLSGDAGFVLIPAKYYTRPTLATRLFDWLAWRLMDVAAMFAFGRTWRDVPPEQCSTEQAMWSYFMRRDGWRPGRYV